jgi:DNA-directed RNA polymerase specialized sigma24 family protein
MALSGDGQTVADPAGGIPRRRWSLTQEAFDGLLATLNADREAAARRYLEIRRNLVRLFEWRGCSTPDEYADETMNRCARKIGEGEAIRDLATYSIGVARMLFRELGRERARETVLAETAEPADLHPEPDAGLEGRVECLTQCLGRLTPENRDFVVGYYQGEKGEKIRNRKGFARLFGIPSNTLRMRALRLREKLQSCVESCVQRSEKCL